MCCEDGLVYPKMWSVSSLKNTCARCQCFSIQRWSFFLVSFSFSRALYYFFSMFSVKYARDVTVLVLKSGLLSFFLCLFLVFARSLLLLRGVIVVVVVVRVVTHHNRRRRLPAAHASFQRRVGRHRCRDGVEFGGGERVVGTQE